MDRERLTWAASFFHFSNATPSSGSIVFKKSTMTVSSAGVHFSGFFRPGIASGAGFAATPFEPRVGGTFAGREDEGTEALVVTRGVFIDFTVSPAMGGSGRTLDEGDEVGSWAGFSVCFLGLQ